MSSLKRIAIAAGVLVVLAVTASAQNTAKLAMSLDELGGTTSKLSEYLQRGPIYLNFWALWCGPCLQELRALDGIAVRNKDSAFTILAVNEDSPRSLAKVKAYISSRGYGFPVILDPNAQLLEAFNGKVLPFSVLLGKDGKIIRLRTGYLPGDEKEIEQDLLNAMR
jgi:thiol-disulfide isomerase/thioredoxin